MFQHTETVGAGVPVKYSLKSGSQGGRRRWFSPGSVIIKTCSTCQFLHKRVTELKMLLQGRIQQLCRFTPDEFSLKELRCFPKTKACRSRQKAGICLELFPLFPLGVICTLSWPNAECDGEEGIILTEASIFLFFLLQLQQLRLTVFSLITWLA